MRVTEGYLIGRAIGVVSYEPGTLCDRCVGGGAALIRYIAAANAPWVWAKPGVVSRGRVKTARFLYFWSLVFPRFLWKEGGFGFRGFGFK